MIDPGSIGRATSYPRHVLFDLMPTNHQTRFVAIGRRRSTLIAFGSLFATLAAKSATGFLVVDNPIKHTFTRLCRHVLQPDPQAVSETLFGSQTSIVPIPVLDLQCFFRRRIAGTVIVCLETRLCHIRGKHIEYVRLLSMEAERSSTDRSFSKPLHVA